MLSYTFALLFSSFCGVLVILFFIRFKNEGGGVNFGMLRGLLAFGFPLSLSSILGGLLTQLFNSLMLLYATTEMIGNYGAAANFGVLVSFLTVPIATVLFPLFSKFKRDDLALQNIYRASVKYTAMITLPVVLVLIVLSAQISRVIFTTGYPLVPLYMSLFILTYSFEGLGGISLSNLISGIGESQVALRSSIITACFGAILAFTLIPSFQMVGLLVAMILAPRAGWVYQTLWAKKNLGIFIDLNSTVRLYLSGFTAFAVSYLLVNGLVLHGWVAIVGGGFAFLFVYLIALLFSGSLTRADIEQIDSLVENLGPFTPLLKRLVDLVGHFTRS
jgi:O-antigen/teichoic acid export membrane protein